MIIQYQHEDMILSTASRELFIAEIEFTVSFMTFIYSYGFINRQIALKQYRRLTLSYSVQRIV